jgi:hypothetical protein
MYINFWVSCVFPFFSSFLFWLPSVCCRLADYSRLCVTLSTTDWCSIHALGCCSWPCVLCTHIIILWCCILLVLNMNVSCPIPFKDDTGHQSEMLNIADAHNSLALLQLLVCEINSNVTMKSCRERETRAFRDRFPGTYGIYTLVGVIFVSSSPFIWQSGKSCRRRRRLLARWYRAIKNRIPWWLVCVCARNVHLYMNRIRERRRRRRGNNT